MKKYIVAIAWVILMFTANMIRVRADGAMDMGVSDNKAPVISIELEQSDYYNNDIYFFNHYPDYRISYEDKGLLLTKMTINEYSTSSNHVGVVNAYSLSGNLIDYSCDEDIYHISAYAMDNNGNESYQTRQVIVDRIAPTIESISCNEIEEMRSFEGIYGMYSGDKIEVKVYLIDNSNGSGVNHLLYYLDGGNPDSAIKIPVENGLALIEVAPNYDGVIHVCGVDNVGNTGEWETTGLFNLEDYNRFQESTGCVIKLPETSYRDCSGYNLYNNDVDITIEAYENFSGINDIEIEVYDSSGLVSITSWNNESFEISEQYLNKIMAVKGTIHVSAESNGIMIKVKLTSNGGYSANYEEYISIDKTCPRIYMEILEGINDSVYPDYYSSNVEINIEIDELNYDISGLEYRINATDKLPESVFSEGDFHCFKDLISIDGTYVITASYTDLAGNKSEEQIVDFIIDKTPPAMEVVWNIEKNGLLNYYNEPRIAEITIFDSNVTPERIYIDTANDNLDEGVGGYIAPDHYGYNMVFDKDGYYGLTVYAVDKAGNTCNSYIETPFIVDMTGPSIKIDGINVGESYNASLQCVVSSFDNNYETGSLEVRVINGEAVDSYSEADYCDITSEYMNIDEYIQEDGRYTLEVEARDLAGNIGNERIDFTVNKSGSSFSVNSEVLFGKYNNNVSSVYILEKNLNRHYKDSFKVYITCNGETLVLDSSNFVPVVFDKGDYFLYEYCLDESYFGTEGSYRVSVSSVDEAGNYNYSMSEANDLNISFGVDKTEPEISLLNIQDDMFENQHGYEARVYISDNMALDNVEIYIDGNSTEYTADNGIYSFFIEEASYKHIIEIVATDFAGNEKRLCVKNVFIYDGALSYYYKDPSMVIGIILNGVGTIGLTLRLMMRHIMKMS